MTKYVIVISLLLLVVLSPDVFAQEYSNNSGITVVYHDMPDRSADRQNDYFQNYTIGLGIIIIVIVIIIAGNFILFKIDKGSKC